MVRTRVTSKGQVTIPVELRRRLKIEAGDDLVFHESGGEVRLHVVHRRRLSDFREALPIAGEVLNHADERRLAARAVAKVDE